MLAPDGTLLCRCHQEKADWYVSRGLAVVESTEPCVVFRLNFQPKGMGNVGEPFYLSDKHNRCVVCGTEDDLTQHHCVPRCFRRNFPEEYKFHTSHDVLPACVSCHTIYEPYAHELKKSLAEQLGLSFNTITPGRGEHSRVIKHALALSRHGEKIPESRRNELYQTLREYFGKQEITEDDIDAACDLDGWPTPAEDKCSKLIVESTTDLDEFVIMWRRHFVDIMNPQFLPDYWSVEHETRRVG